MLFRHGHRQAELKRSSASALDAGDQLCLGVASEKPAVEGDERVCSRLRGMLNHWEPRVLLKDRLLGPRCAL